MEPKVTDVEELKEIAANVVKDVIVNTFSMMAGLEATIGETYTNDPSADTRRSISGVIGWVGKFTGTGILDCSPEFACLLSNLMLGTEGDVLNEDALDAVAEMTNMVFGGMKTGLEDHCGAMGLSIPTVIYGNNVGMRSSGGRFIVVPVKIDKHELKVMMYFAKTEETRNSPAHFWASTSAGAL
jgi:CheY-specific phosphatase CheX